MNRMGRRRAIKNVGVVGAALLAGCNQDSPTSADAPTTTTTAASSTGTAISCVLTPSLTEGPFYFDAGLVRRDITEARPGVPLELALTVVDASSCEPIRDAVADIWHCDAGGAYSGYSSEGTSGQRFLRGVQATDADGVATFDTLYPGWYQGRTVHIHMKVHLDERSVLTSQLFFPESVSDEVYALSPYNTRGSRTTTNASDGIFDSGAMLEVSRLSGGYRASLVIGVSSA